MDAQDDVARQFDAHRGYLHSMAYRMLGAHSEAEDAVQEAWLRLSRTDASALDNLRAWLTTVTARICLDLLRSRGARREQPLQLTLSEGREPAADTPDPEAEAVLAESVSLALYVVLDTLTPAERVAFVLHDLFAVPFGAIAVALGRSEAATKMLASRARTRVRLDGPPSGPAADRPVVEAFFAAARDGDLDALLALLAPDLEMRVDGPLGTNVVRGAAAIAGRATMFARDDAVVRPVLVDGRPGVLVSAGGQPISLMAFTVEEDTVIAIRAVVDPERLARLVPDWLART